MPSTSWPEAFAKAIRAALTVAAADPSGAHRLVVPVAGRRTENGSPFDVMVGDLVTRVRRGAPAGFKSERAARNLVLQIARQVCLHLETRRGEPVTVIAPDLIVLALTPCVGLAEARRLADQPIETS